MTAARDYEGLLAAMREQIPHKLPEWTGHDNAADFGRVLLELFAHMGDLLGYYQDRVAAEALLGTARTRRSVVAHLRLIGYELRTAAPAAAALRISVPETVTDKVDVRPGDAFATRSRRGAPSVRFEYAGAAKQTIDFKAVPVDAATGRRVFDGLAVEEGRLVAAEVLGESDGRADQGFPLARPGLIRRPGNAGDLRVRAGIGIGGGAGGAGGGPVDWTVVDTLAFSQGGPPHCVVEVDADDRATVRFGDGQFGAIPSGRVTATYRVGGGAAGNVAPLTITTIVSSALAALGATVTNAAAASGGADREDAAQAVRHAPAVFRTLDRAVTTADYEALTASFAGVAKVRATRGAWNEVVLHVVPEGGGDVSDVLEAGLIAFLEDKRMLGQVVTVVGVAYQPVLVTARIGVDTRHVFADVVERVRATVAGLLDLARVDFGQPLYLSRFYEAIQDTEGVLFAEITEFRRADATDPGVQTHGVLEFAPFELPVPPDRSDYPGGVALLPTRGRR